MQIDNGPTLTLYNIIMKWQISAARLQPNSRWYPRDIKEKKEEEDVRE